MEPTDVTVLAARTTEESGGGGGGKTAHVQSGPTGGQFTSSPGSKSTPTKPTAKKPVPKKSQPSSGSQVAPIAKKRQTLSVKGPNDPEQVKQLQALLKELKISGLAVDGNFGGDTEAAVKAVQEKLGLKPTGRCSASLLGTLEKVHALSPCVVRASSQVLAAAGPVGYDEDEVLDKAEIAPGMWVCAHADGSVSMRMPSEAMAKWAGGVLEMADSRPSVRASQPHPGQRYRHGWIPLAGVDLPDNEDDTESGPDWTLSAKTKAGDVHVVAFEDHAETYGGGRVVAIGESRHVLSGGPDEAPVVLRPADARAVADGLDNLAVSARSAKPTGDPDEGPMPIGTAEAGGRQLAAYHDENGDLGPEGSRYIVIGDDNNPTADWDGAGSVIYLDDVPALTAAIRQMAAAPVVARRSYAGQKWRHGWIPFGGKGKTDMPDAPKMPPPDVRPETLSDIAYELEGLTPDEQRAKLEEWGFSPGVITELLGPIRVDAAAGKDVTPGHDEMHHYWTKGEGLAKWADSPTPWTTLYHHLIKFADSPEEAKRWASRWFIEVFHFAAGSDLNRVTHGKPPRGSKVGPG